MREESRSRGRLVGRYVVHDRIAAGGMATVHVGRLLGPAGFSRTVAIKRLHDQYARDPDFVAMLLDEARLAATIRHPNVVPTMDVVVESDELLVVMDYVEGDSVAHLAKLLVGTGQRVPPSYAASIVAQALHGLHAAHEARDKNGEPLGIVHRDVSPQNILVGVDGIARVLDFGIAKAASRATSTEDGQIKGKTAYMAPEQLQHGRVDRRTDVFAAAVVLWELLCARRLFFADSPSETIGRVLGQVVEPPHRYATDLPPGLSAIVLRGLERDPEARFQSAEEMALAIEDAVDLPRAKELGTWVSSVAKATLDARAALVHLVETSSHRMPAAAAPSDPELARAIEEAERRRAACEMPTDVGVRGPSSGPASPARGAIGAPPVSGFDEGTGLATVNSTAHPVVRPPSRAWVAVAIAAAGAVLVLVVAVAAVLRTKPVVAATTSSPASSPPLVVVEAPPSQPPAPPPPATSVSASAAPAKPPVRPPVRPPAGKTPDCRIPFTVDAKGNKHFKEECLN
jgi:serine/threonine-protein kinase